MRDRKKDPWRCIYLSPFLFFFCFICLMIVTLEYERRVMLWGKQFPESIADLSNVRDLLWEIETNQQEHELFLQRNKAVLSETQKGTASTP